MENYKMNLFFKGKIGAFAFLSAVFLMEPAGAVRVDHRDPVQIDRLHSAVFLVTRGPDILEMLKRVETYPSRTFPEKQVMTFISSRLLALATEGNDGYKPLELVGDVLKSIENYLGLEIDESTPLETVFIKFARMKHFECFLSTLFLRGGFFDFCNPFKYEPLTQQQKTKIREQEMADGVRLLRVNTQYKPSKTSDVFGQIFAVLHDSEKVPFQALIDFLESKPENEIGTASREASVFIEEMENFLRIKNLINCPPEIFSLEDFVDLVNDKKTFPQLLSYYEKSEQAKKSGTESQLPIPSHLSKAHRATEENPELFNILKSIRSSGIPVDNHKNVVSSLRNIVLQIAEIHNYFSSTLPAFKARGLKPLREFYVVDFAKHDQQEEQKPNEPDDRRVEGKPVAHKINASSEADQG